jgi:hypothetical protein
MIYSFENIDLHGRFAFILYIYVIETYFGENAWLLIVQMFGASVVFAIYKQFENFYETLFRINAFFLLISQLLMRP